MDDDIARYAGREATWVKHQVLRQYLQKLAYKVGWWASTLNYVDGFAGPWRAASEDLSDTSPHIAIRELRAARDGLVASHKSAPVIRCLFIEKNPDSFQKLDESVKAITDVRIDLFHGEFEQHIPEILSFVKAPENAFTFFFIDPTGWSGFGMKAIAPLLQHSPCEVLINFMTKDIKRFIDDPNSVALPTFKDLFGATDYRKHWNGLNGQDREDAIVQAYCDHVRLAGNYKHVVSAVVLHPTDERTHFHLIYGTRSDEGLRTFRSVEAKTMEKQESIRARTQQIDRVTKTRQQELFSAAEMGSKGHYERLRDRYTIRSHAAVLELLQSRKRVSFDELEMLALTMPMTWLSDLQAWLKEWRSADLIEIENLAPRERTLKAGKNHIVNWTK